MYYVSEAHDPTNFLIQVNSVYVCVYIYIYMYFCQTMNFHARMQINACM